MNQTTEWMEKVLELFVSTVQAVLDNRDAPTRLYLEGFIANHARHTNATMALSDKEFGNLRDEIFASLEQREFLWDVSFRFFGRLGYDSATRDLLCMVLATALGTDDVQTDHGQNDVQTPAAIAQYLPSRHLCFSRLLGNKWLVVLVLLLMTSIRTDEDIAALVAQKDAISNG